MQQMIELALTRAGASDLAEFQRANGLPETGTLDEATENALEPWLLGYREVTVAQDDTFYRLARRYGTTVEAIETANPGVDPGQLRIGSTLIVPLGFSVVPTNIPMSAELCEKCILGLAARYPFCRTKVLATTAYGRPIRTLEMGTGPWKAMYNASHHANEWITTPVLLRFAEELATAIAFDGEVDGIPGRELAQLATVYMVPMVNPDGVDLVVGAIGPGNDGYESARTLSLYYPWLPFPDGWKANLLGVNLNLNYPAGWEQARRIKAAQGFTRPGPRDYVGKAPLNQQETAAMAAYTQAVNPDLVIACHTQGGEIYWQFLDIFVPGARERGERFEQVSGYRLADTPYNSSFAGYKDWFIQEYIRPGYTTEAGFGENPLPISQFPSILRATRGILVLGLLPPEVLFPST